MNTYTLSPALLPHIEAVVGPTLDDKLMALLETYLTTQLRACEQEIGEYEVKYRTTFAEFAQAWEDDQTPAKYDHTVERDFMEWEGLLAEKQRWLQSLRKLPKREVVVRAM
ncbi:MAG: hypothetical protein K1X65_08115 [Caldilineales bacterium]|nr:hypothetical protein [Caldilineales bacterium]MCW5859444.1 hypothetical protein [Caldilineales bacterium]